MLTPSLIQVSPADSARVVEEVYTASLLMTIPLAAAIFATVFLRNGCASTRAAVFRALFISLFAIFIGTTLPFSWISVSLPEILSAPLVLLGRAQMTMVESAAPNLSASQSDAGIVTLLLLAYLAGVLIILLPAIQATFRLRRVSRRAWPIRDAQWTSQLFRAASAINLRRDVRLLCSDTVKVPGTWGVFFPVVVIPKASLRLSDDEKFALLLHELSHVKSCDWPYSLLARLACAFFWFNPVVWWAARSMHDECELACDDRVLLNGIRASDYAEFLVGSSRSLLGATSGDSLSMAFARQSGLRRRLSAICETQRILSPARAAAPLVAFTAFVVTVSTSTMSLAPDSVTLTQLMRDASWQTRAYAVRGLAQRADTMHFAQLAANEDPDPQVRAWARAAIDAQSEKSTY